MSFKRRRTACFQLLQLFDFRSLFLMRSAIAVLPRGARFIVENTFQKLCYLYKYLREPTAPWADGYIPLGQTDLQ